MRKTMTLRFGFLACVLCVSCSGGGGSSDGGAEAAAPVSFQNDLVPQLAMKCGLSSSCHQEQVQDPKVQRVFLGCSTSNPSCTGSSPDVVYQGLLAASQENPTMPYVKRGDPANSYVVYKLDGDLSNSMLQCLPLSMDPILQGATGEQPTASQPCGAQMPLNGGSDTALAAQVRAWIVQGAPEN
jgi:hypothetical protein